MCQGKTWGFCMERGQGGWGFVTTSRHLNLTAVGQAAPPGESRNCVWPGRPGRHFTSSSPCHSLHPRGQAGRTGLPSKGRSAPPSSAVALLDWDRMASSLHSSPRSLPPLFLFLPVAPSPWERVAVPHFPHPRDRSIPCLPTNNEPL